MGFQPFLPLDHKFTSIAIEPQNFLIFLILHLFLFKIVEVG